MKTEQPEERTMTKLNDILIYHSKGIEITEQLGNTITKFINDLNEKTDRSVFAVYIKKRYETERIHAMTFVFDKYA